MHIKVGSFIDGLGRAWIGWIMCAKVGLYAYRLSMAGWMAYGYSFGCMLIDLAVCALSLIHI